MTPKRLWKITGALFLVYLTVYVSLALYGIYNSSRHLSWQENLILSILLILSVSSVIAAVIALIPFGGKKISDRFFHVTFPVAASMFIVLFGFAWGYDLYNKSVKGVYGAFDISNTVRDSHNFPDQKERVAALKTYIHSFSDFSDAEFSLFNVNGFGEDRMPTTPGASSWNYKFVIKVKLSDIPAWEEGMTPLDSLNEDISWTTELIKTREENWKTESVPKYFKREGENVLMLVYEQEGIIFKKIVNE